MTYAKKKINNLLLVDSTKSSRYINEVFIKKTNFVKNVLITTNGLEAIEVINKGIIPEIILLNLNMPIADGWDFLSLFYNNPNYSKSKIVVMLAETLEDFKADFAKKEYHIQDFSSKIISKAELSYFIEDYQQKNSTLVH